MKLYGAIDLHSTNNLTVRSATYSRSVPFIFS
jgi:hypothetical protein